MRSRRGIGSETDERIAMSSSLFRRMELVHNEVSSMIPIIE
jgi:hypothetical protein